MASYGANILHNEAAFYTLNNASIINHRLILQAGGSASTTITETDLVELTEWFRVSIIATPFCNYYEGTLRVYVKIVDDNGDEYNITCFPCDTGNGVYLQEFQAKKIKYQSFIFRIEADVATTVTLWELQPEAADSNIDTIIDGVKQSLPRLLFDYNTSPLTVEQDETTVAMITCRLLSATDIQGHFAITFISTHNSTVTIRFYDNEAEELYAPMYYDVEPGRTTIGIPHSYLKRKASIHSFVVTMQTEQGRLDIGTRGCLFTIDGGYLAERLIDVAMDVTDLTIRQLVSDSGPDQIWVVGLDEGEALVRYRDYMSTNANISWTAVGSFGRAIHAAIEFNGTWELRELEHKCTLITEQNPYVFIVDMSNDLWAYHGATDLDPFLIDTDVTYVRACRGFASVEYPERDQGLVVVFVKMDGTVWYRQLVWNVAGQSFQWLDAAQIGNEQWETVNVTRLNDYRISIQLSRADKNKWIYTDRTYVGQAFQPEFLNAYLDYVDYSFCDSPRTAEEFDVAVDEITTTEEAAESGNFYTWTCAFHFTRRLRFRGNWPVEQSITLTGDLLAHKTLVTFNERTNCVEVQLNMTQSISEVSIVQGALSINSLNGWAVATYPGEGWAAIRNLTAHWIIDNSVTYEVPQSENILLGSSSSTFVWEGIRYRRQTIAPETITLPANSAAAQNFVLEPVNFEQLTIRTENVPFLVNTTMTNTFTYEGTHVDPI